MVVKNQNQGPKVSKKKSGSKRKGNMRIIRCEVIGRYSNLEHSIHFFLPDVFIKEKRIRSVSG